jgi:hypothetical protein
MFTWSLCSDCHKTAVKALTSTPTDQKLEVLFLVQLIIDKIHFLLFIEFTVHFFSKASMKECLN